MFLFCLVLPLWTMLLAVDVEGEPEEAGTLHFTEEILGEGEAVCVEDGLPATIGHHPYDVHHLGVSEGIPTGYGNAVYLAVTLEDVEVFPYLFERLVFVYVRPVTPFAREVALHRGLEPGDGVVREVPRKSIQFSVVECCGH